MLSEQLSVFVVHQRGVVMEGKAGREIALQIVRLMVESKVEGSRVRFRLIELLVVEPGVQSK